MTKKQPKKRKPNVAIKQNVVRQIWKRKVIALKVVTNFLKRAYCSLFFASFLTVLRVYINKSKDNMKIVYIFSHPDDESFRSGGGSGHHDHIPLHHIIKRLFFDKKGTLQFWKRLAYFTVIDTGIPMFFEGRIPRVTWTKKEDVMVTEKLDNANIKKMKEALLCYDTYQEMVKTTNIIDRIGDKTYFELENETHPKMLSSITELIND